MAESQAGAAAAIAGPKDCSRGSGQHCVQLKVMGKHGPAALSTPYVWAAGYWMDGPEISRGVTPGRSRRLSGRAKQVEVGGPLFADGSSGYRCDDYTLNSTIDNNACLCACAYASHRQYRQDGRCLIHRLVLHTMQPGHIYGSIADRSRLRWESFSTNTPPPRTACSLGIADIAHPQIADRPAKP
jgi:hypothetical protein